MPSVPIALASLYAIPAGDGKAVRVNYPGVSRPDFKRLLIEPDGGILLHPDLNRLLERRVDRNLLLKGLTDPGGALGAYSHLAPDGGFGWFCRVCLSLRKQSRKEHKS